MIRVFIGYDPVESVALQVLTYSIHKYASRPVSITPINIRQLPYTRERDPKQSTEFSFSRFLVPWMCGYKGHAIFMDCDMLCLGDIAELWDMRPTEAVAVVPKDYQPENATKFLGNPQSKYQKKLWSAMMIFNNEECRELTPEYVNSASGMQLHQFEWAKSIKHLPQEWQWIAQDVTIPAKLVHYTEGTPCFPEYYGTPHAGEWFRHYFEMTRTAH